MPQLTLPVAPEGCTLTVYVGVSSDRQAVLRAKRENIPEPIEINAMIDTGGSCTAIDAKKLVPLKMTPTGIGHIHTPSTKGQAAAMPQYDVSLAFVAPSGSFVASSVPIIALPEISNTGIDALIGRDILSKCLLVYNGVEKKFTLAF